MKDLETKAMAESQRRKNKLRNSKEGKLRKDKGIKKISRGIRK